MTKAVYRTWLIRRDGTVQGPFPEPLVCRFMVLGRVRAQDEVSLDGSYWRTAAEVQELQAGVRDLLDGGVANPATDPQWAEERAKASRRWLDDRKSLDPRARNAGRPLHGMRDQRRGGDRRLNPETVEQHAYREGRSEYESWMRRQRQRYGLVAAFLGFAVLMAVIFSLFYRPVNPIKIDFRVSTNDCQAEATAAVNWSGCNKDEALLVGADLQGAELVGTSLKHANLSFADLRHANLSQADVTGADLDGARLGDAIWVDGRLCAPDSIGGCQ